MIEQVRLGVLLVAQGLKDVRNITQTAGNLQNVSAKINEACANDTGVQAALNSMTTSIADFGARLSDVEIISPGGYPLSPFLFVCICAHTHTHTHTERHA